MKKFIISIIVVFGMVTSAWASTYSGSIKVDDGLVAHDDWNLAELSWTVENMSNSPYWTYDYWWDSNSAGHFLSHMDIEVSENFDFTNDLLSWFSHGTAIDKVEGPQWFNEISGDIYGIKWELGTDTETFHLTLISTRMPMWGDIYVKNGLGGAVYAMNSEFGFDANDPIGDGNNGGWVLVPDTIVPIPGAVWLFGSGLIGLVGLRRRSRVA